MDYIFKNLDTIKHFEFTLDINKFINECDCFVMPSYREGTSRSLLEAASVGRPIITTDVPGCNNIVKDGFNGYLCKPKDYLSLYNACEKMLNTSYDKRLYMSLKSNELINNKYNIQTINNQILDTIDLNA